MANQEGLVLDGLDLNTTPLVLVAFDYTTPKKRYEWVQAADSDGSALVRDPLHDNRELTLTLAVDPRASMELAMDQIGLVVDKLEEAERQRDGLALVWTPATSTESFTFYVLSGEITDLPVTFDSGWFSKSPTFTVNLICDPYGHGSEVTVSSSSSTEPIISYTVAGVTGDAPAEARLLVTDNATQTRRHLEWGLETRYYSASNAVILDSDSLVTSGFSGTGNTRAGAYDPNATGNSVVRSTVLGLTTACCGTGVLAHIGTYRIKARVWADATDVSVRLAWQSGDGGFITNVWAPVLVANDFFEVDLGVITIPEKRLGTQKWSGRVEAKTSSTSSRTLDVDFIGIIPAQEGYGKARAAFTYTPGVNTGYDEFTGITAGTALNGRSAVAGGTWATSGATTDFAAADTPVSTDETELRTTVSDSGWGRFAILGSTNYTDTEARINLYRTAETVAGGAVHHAVIARWVDSSNYLRFKIVSGTLGVTPAKLVLEKVVAGSVTTLATAWAYGANSTTWYTLRVIVFASGTVVAHFLEVNGGILYELSARDTALATGGTLATGKPGFNDYNGGAVATSRYYDNFYSSTPAAEPIVAYSGRVCEIRSDSAVRQDSTGTYYGPVPGYRGSRFFLPPAGDENRTSRLAVKLRRNDIETAADSNVADSTTVQVRYTPRYLVIPR